jgi:hypothetical protein
MSTPTYTLLNQITLAAATSSVTFSNIPQNYGDLVLVVNYAPTTNTDSPYFQVNNSAANYSVVWMLGGSGNTTSSGSSGPRAQIPILFAVGATVADGSNNVIFQIMDYAQTDKHKSMLIRANSNTNEVAASTARWADTSAITSVSLSSTALSSTLKAGSTFSLYGIAA